MNSTHLSLFMLTCLLVGRLPAALPPPTTFSQLSEPWLGRPVFIVDRLDDYAESEKAIPHTLRWALEQLREEGGIVVFRRSGTIQLQRKLRIPVGTNNWLIAGYTAPPPGIAIVRHGMDVAGQNWSIEHVRIRPGSAAYNSSNGDKNDALGITGERDVTLSPDPAVRERLGIKNARVVNCSLSWASDELVQLWFPPIVNVDFVRCIFTEPMHDPELHPKPEVHGFGPLVASDVGPVAFNECLFANCLRRNPRINDGCLVFIGNSVLLNPGGTGVEMRNAAEFRPNGKPKTPRLPGGALPRPLTLAVTHTLFIPGPDTQRPTNLLTQGDTLNPESRLYARNDFRWSDGQWRLIADGETLETEEVTVFTKWQTTLPIVPPGFVGLSPAKLETQLFAGAGAFPRIRDAVDQRVLDQLINRTGRKILRQSDAGLNRFERPHDADGYEILSETRWADGADPTHEWALPENPRNLTAMRAWLEAKRQSVEP